MRELTYEKEAAFFSPNAFFSKNTVGREVAIDADPIRTEFQRDRDRIIHSKAFRRLMHKMQVFLAPAGDHYRTRLTHTLEVSQIARGLAVALRLNEDLTEAAALGHDIGHTPFGHSGERVLNELCEGGFRHNEQSLRVVSKLENLNLTAEVLDGIYCHKLSNKAKTLEGQLVRIADKIAYINHDIDDALRAGLIKFSDIPTWLIEVLGGTHSARISTMINAVISCGAGDEIRMEPRIFEATMQLREFMFERVYRHPCAISEDGRIYEMLRLMWTYFKAHNDKIPSEYRKNIDSDGLDRVVADYIASMTDRYAMAIFDELFVPKIWKN